MASLSAPDFRSVAMVLSASEYTRVTRNVSPVPSFFHNCPIWILDTLFAIFRLYVYRPSVSTGWPGTCTLPGKPVASTFCLRFTGGYRAAFRLVVWAAASLEAEASAPAAASSAAVAADAVPAFASAADAAFPSAGGGYRSLAVAPPARAVDLAS